MDRMSEPVLCVANFPANTGYAWNFIEGLYASLANAAAGASRKVYVAYPEIASDPVPLQGSKAIPVCLDLSLGSLRNGYRAMRWVRAHGIRTVYFTDRLHWSVGFLWLRLGGVRRIVVHLHTATERKSLGATRLLLKRIRSRLPWINADQVIAVSDHVASGFTETFPASKITRLWNPVDDACAPGEPMSTERPLLVCACRADANKGVHILLQAFDRVAERMAQRNLKPQLYYLGDGPYFAELQRLWGTLKHQDQIKLLGYRKDAKQLIAAADICVVPSMLQEACSLAIAEAMISAKAVIACRVGGNPELIEDGVRGLLVPPGDVAALAGAIEALVLDPAMAKRLGEQAREHAKANFDRQRYLEHLQQLVFGTFHF